MNKPVYITADSTCDLSPELLERFHIKVIPLHVLLGEESYLDGVDFIPDMIFERYRANKTLPTTAAVSPQEFQEFFKPLVESGYDVVHLDISAELSASYQNAGIAAQEFPGVYPINTCHLSSSIGLLLFEACRLRDEGKGAKEIVRAVNELIPKVQTSFVIDTLEYLWKGGRCTGVAAFGANLLNLKPCIEMREGKLEVGKKYRGNILKVYEKYVAERLTGRKVRPDYVFITSSSELSADVEERLKETIRGIVPVREIIFARAGSTISSHCGPGTMGILFLEA
ncbi:MAG: DegV family protein [Ruminiclostridium sp.]|nr:DegV family protein [Ruminiclostridium sp.]